MDIYDGGGNFSCGLEEGSTMRSTWAVDNFDGYESDACITPIWPILRIRCNILVPLMACWWLQLAANTPGSCQDPEKWTSFRPGAIAKALLTRIRNDLMKVSAFIDFYPPKYTLLEDVIIMASSSMKSRNENVFCRFSAAWLGSDARFKSLILTPRVLATTRAGRGCSCRSRRRPKATSSSIFIPFLSGGQRRPCSRCRGDRS